jgi:hypothetical protein
MARTVQTRNAEKLRIAINQAIVYNDIDFYPYHYKRSTYVVLHLYSQEDLMCDVFEIRIYDDDSKNYNPLVICNGRPMPIRSKDFRSAIKRLKEWQVM